MIVVVVIVVIVVVIIVVFLPNFDESSMSSTWHVKWDPGTRLEFRWNEATESVNFSRTF